MRHVFLSALLVCSPAWATDAVAEPPTDLRGARNFMEETLGLIEKRRWKELKGRIHPVTLRAMEERRHRTGKDRHGLSFWSHVKEWRIRRWRIADVEAGPRNTAVVLTREDHFLVRERGMDLGRESAWLLVRTDGAPGWLLLDRRNGTDAFTPESIERGYAEALPARREMVPRTPLANYQARLEKAVRAKLAVPEHIPAHQRGNMSCTVRVMVDEGGAVLSRTVVKASGNPHFDRAVLKGIDAVGQMPAPGPALRDEAENGVLVRLSAR